MQRMRERYVYVSVFTAQVVFMIGSSSITWSSPMLVKLNGTVDNPLGRLITHTENSALASVAILGACFGSVLLGAVASRIGRKTLLMLLSLPHLICYLSIAFATTYEVFFIGRFLAGIGLGGIYTILPMYTCELADSNNRGILGPSMTIFFYLGTLIPYILGQFVSFFTFHIILGSLPIIYLPLVLFFSLESPYYLIQRDFDAAEYVLRKLRGKADVSGELEEIRKQIAMTSGGSYMEVFKTTGTRKAFIIGLGLVTFKTLTGTSIVTMYNETIFHEAGGFIPDGWNSIIVGTVEVITISITSFVSKKFKRKTLLMISHLGVAVVEIPLGFYFILKRNKNDVSDITWLPLLCLICYVILFNVGIGPLLLTYIGELFPLRVKGLSVSIMMLHLKICIFLLTFSFKHLVEVFGMGLIFWGLSVFSFIGALFIKFFVIETRGKTLYEIQEKLNSRDSIDSEKAIMNGSIKTEL